MDNVKPCGKCHDEMEKLKVVDKDEYVWYCFQCGNEEKRKCLNEN